MLPSIDSATGIDDAILIEVYADGTKRTPRSRFAFVTRNVKDFSYPNASNKLPRPDTAACFSRVGMINGKTSALRWVLGDEWECWIRESARSARYQNRFRRLGTFANRLIVGDCSFVTTRPIAQKAFASSRS